MRPSCVPFTLFEEVVPVFVPLLERIGRYSFLQFPFPNLISSDKPSSPRICVGKTCTLNCDQSVVGRSLSFTDVEMFAWWPEALALLWSCKPLSVSSSYTSIIQTSHNCKWKRAKWILVHQNRWCAARSSAMMLFGEETDNTICIPAQAFGASLPRTFCRKDRTSEHLEQEWWGLIIMSHHFFQKLREMWGKKYN